VVGLVACAVWLCLSNGESPARPVLRMDRAGSFGGGAAVGAQSTNVVLDDLRHKYHPERRVVFHVITSEPSSVFVPATGVQVRGTSGWQTVYEEYRGDVCRLKPGMAREVCVERPEAEVWRAYVRYGTEMKGASLLSAQLKEAWKIRSFTNWTGRAWGGGRWSGVYELLSEEVTD
jgi:hypothetical protein